jgi:hypothetical protein
LYDLVGSLIDDGDETRTDGQHSFLCVFWAPIGIKRWGYCLREPNGKDLREFFDAKRANRYRETSKETLCISSFLLIDSQQCATICFVQGLR